MRLFVACIDVEPRMSFENYIDFHLAIVYILTISVRAVSSCLMCLHCFLIFQLFLLPGTIILLFPHYIYSVVLVAAVCCVAYAIL